ncbi:MAG TPA: TIGR03067 domain-containing protein [Gemmataceae bacterium]|nr:TIGR03067 domain-containing protein [Gemmataceae bacterium]
MKTRCLALLVIGLLLAADDPKKKDLDKLQGTWIASSIEYNGEKVLGDKELKVVIEGDKLTVKSEDTEASKYGTATLKIDPSTTPKIMDVSIIKGDEKGTTFEAIYDVDKDEWKLCLKPTGKERPAKFESKADSGDVLIVFKREKK